ncbi:MAG: 23S rRNA (pseudouridine(1915)-N(3))-methyltransferase RlmH [Methanomicrobiales archaeon]|nr:23S rRNA (pseudouridine(1915)-N(3))-methyltransferase RlmH [Methanomicrobiales archaeon]
MQIHVIAVGKVKEPYLREGIEEYTKRLRVYTTLHFLEVSDVRVSPGASESQKESVRAKEGQLLLRAAPPGSHLIALHPAGEEWSSAKLTERIRTWEVEGPHTVAFLIGGELGHIEEVLDTSSEILSLSRMTFPHQLVRLILLEALYRSFRQLRGEPYSR